MAHDEFVGSPGYGYWLVLLTRCYLFYFVLANSPVVSFFYTVLQAGAVTQVAECWSRCMEPRPSRPAPHSPGVAAQTQDSSTE